MYELRHLNLINIDIFLLRFKELVIVSSSKYQVLKILLLQKFLNYSTKLL